LTTLSAWLKRIDEAEAQDMDVWRRLQLAANVI
jgi:hypothetical protein